MSSGAQDARRKDIHAERDKLATLDARLAGLTQAYKDADVAHVAACITMDKLDPEIEELNAQRLATKVRRDALLQEYRREFMATIPHDILRCIMEELVAHDEFRTRQRSVYLTNMPFRVAAVCKRWRLTALETPVLWSLIHVTNCNARQLERVKLLLERSRRAALDIFIVWSPVTKDEAFAMNFLGSLSINATPHWRPSEHGPTILETLASHASRWRRMELVSHVDWIKGWRVLEQPLPALEDFCVCHAVYDVKGAKGCLPSAPRLRSLTVLASRLAFHSTTSYSCLVSLTWLQPDIDFAWSILAAAASTLETVELSPSEGTARAQSSDLPLLTLPKLRFLALGMYMSKLTPIYGFLRAPNLQKLCIQGPAVHPDILQFLLAVAPTVTHLILSKAMDSGHVAFLRTLTNVSRLEFTRTSTLLNTDYTVDDKFFVELAKPGAAGAYVFPQLSSILLEDNGSFTSRGEEGQGLLQFARSRTAPHLDEHSTPRRLKEMTVSAQNVRGRLRAEVKRIVGEKTGHV